MATIADADIAAARTVNMDELMAFVVVADEKSMVRAAARLHWDRSTPGRLLYRLERRWNIHLIVSTTRKISLTPVGARLLPQAREVIAAAAHIANLARAHHQAPRPPASDRAVLLDEPAAPSTEIVLP